MCKGWKARGPFETVFASDHIAGLCHKNDKSGLHCIGTYPITAPNHFHETPPLPPLIAAVLKLHLFFFVFVFLFPPLSLLLPQLCLSHSGSGTKN